MADPNDEAISGHRSYEKGFREVRWVGVVQNSDLVTPLSDRTECMRKSDQAGAAN